MERNQEEVITNLKPLGTSNEMGLILASIISGVLIVFYCLYTMRTKCDEYAHREARRKID